MARLLLLEEEPNIAAIIVSKLSREGHEVRWEDQLEAAHALELVAEQPLDLVLIDVDGGWEPTLAALSTGRRILALVSGTEAGSAERARDAGATAVVVKPFKPTVLARLVAQLVGSADTAGRGS